MEDTTPKVTEVIRLNGKPGGRTAIPLVAHRQQSRESFEPSRGCYHGLFLERLKNACVFRQGFTLCKCRETRSVFLTGFHEGGVIYDV